MTDQANNTEAAGFRLLLTPDRAALNANAPTTLRVLVRAQAPDVPAEAAPRPPLHLALVLDRSGSMLGRPLEEAKRCARNIVDSLAPGDRAAIIAFDDEVERVAPLTTAADKLALASALAGITCGGTTDLHGGWRMGADELAAQLTDDGVHRVILLSDGCANHGETALEVITQQCKAFAQRGVTTSTYGLGTGFNEALMLAMAAAGRGNAYYGQTAADLAEPFASEFALLANLAARGLVLKVNAPDHVTVKLCNTYETIEGAAHGWQLPDVAFASEAWALLEIEVPALPLPADVPVTLPITVSLHAATRDSAPLFLMAALPPLPAIPAEARRALPSDDLVARRTLEIAAAQMLDDVQAAIAADNWERAQRLVDDAATRFAGHPWASAVLATMRRLVGERDKRLAMKESAYGNLNFSRRLATKDEAMFSTGDGDDVPLYLRRKAEQGKGRRDPG